MTDQNQFVENQNRTETAEEMDQNTQAIYRNDLLYLFFKLLMFVILGGVIYYLFRDQDPGEIVNRVKEKAISAVKGVRGNMEPKDIVKV